MALREIILDTETTGLYTFEGERIVEVGAVEMIDGKLTGKSFHSYINPERHVPELMKNGKGEMIKNPNGLTDDFLADKPLFAHIAKELRDFIGDDRVVITCRTSTNNYVLDVAFMNMELTKAGQAEIPDAQWLNVRTWSEAMFGDAEASLNKVLDRYGIDRGTRSDTGHGALLDAQLLAEFYPQLKKDYAAFTAISKTPAAKPPKP